jgi:hypothetical protein
LWSLFNNMLLYCRYYADIWCLNSLPSKWLASLRSWGDRAHPGKPSASLRNSVRRRRNPRTAIKRVRLRAWKRAGPDELLLLIRSPWGASVLGLGIVVMILVRARRGRSAFLVTNPAASLGPEELLPSGAVLRPEFPKTSFCTITTPTESCWMHADDPLLILDIGRAKGYHSASRSLNL